MNTKGILYRKPQKVYILHHDSGKQAGASVTKASLGTLYSVRPSGAASQKRSEGPSVASKAQSHTTDTVGAAYASDSTVALAGASGGAGVGAWERNRLRLAFHHGSHEAPSARSKCAAFWAQLENQPEEIHRMCARGHAKGGEERAAAVAEAEAAFREYMGKDWDCVRPVESKGQENSTTPQECAWAENSACEGAASCADCVADSGGDGGGADDPSACMGKMKLCAMAAAEAEDGVEEGTVGPWQRRLRALQALGLDRLAAAAEWRESPIRAPEGWPHCLLVNGTGGGDDGGGGVGGAAGDAPGGTAPAALQMGPIAVYVTAPSPEQESPSTARLQHSRSFEQLMEDVRNLPRPRLPTEPGGTAPADHEAQVYRTMPKYRLPPPDEPGPPPAPVYPCPTEWCGPRPCGECIPCDPRYASQIHPQGSVDQQYGGEEAGNVKMAALEQQRGDEWRGADGRRHTHRKHKKHRHHKEHRRSQPCPPGCRCCRCVAPPPTPTLASRRSTAASRAIGGSRISGERKGLPADTTGGEAHGDMFDMPEERGDVSQMSREHSGEMEVSRRNTEPKVIQRSREATVTKVTSFEATTAEHKSGRRKTADGGFEGERVDSSGELVDEDRRVLKEEDPFRSVLLDVLRPGHVRPPLPPPSKPVEPPPKEPVHKQPEFKKVVPGLYALRGPPGRQPSTTSLCSTMLPPHGPPPPPRPPKPSHYVGPGADLSGMEPTSLPPTIAPDGATSHYVGVGWEDDKGYSSWDAAPLQPVRPPPRASAAATAAATSAISAAVSSSFALSSQRASASTDYTGSRAAPGQRFSRQVSGRAPSTVLAATTAADYTAPQPLVLPPLL